MATNKKMMCPRFQRECIEDGTIVGNELWACRSWIKIMGKDPTTGADFERSDCAETWVPILLIENSQQQRQTGAAVESFRNEMVMANENSQKILLAAAQLKQKQFMVPAHKTGFLPDGESPAIPSSAFELAENKFGNSD